MESQAARGMTITKINTGNYYVKLKEVNSISNFLLSLKNLGIIDYDKIVILSDKLIIEWL